MITFAKIGGLAALVLGVLVGCTYAAEAIWGSDGLAVAPLWLATLGVGVVMTFWGRHPEVGAGLVGGAAAFAIVAIKFLSKISA